MSFRKFDLTEAESKKLLIIFFTILAVFGFIAVIGLMLMGLASLFSAREIVETIGLALFLTGGCTIVIWGIFISIKYPGFPEPPNPKVEQYRKLEKLYKDKDITEEEYIKLQNEIAESETKNDT